MFRFYTVSKRTLTSHNRVFTLRGTIPLGLKQFGEDFTLDGRGKRKFCVFDFEATGPDQLNDFITQIGAVILGPDGSVVEQYKTFV